jgi:hypothetical protein
METLKNSRIGLFNPIGYGFIRGVLALSVSLFTSSMCRDDPYASLFDQPHVKTFHYLIGCRLFEEGGKNARSAMGFSLSICSAGQNVR